LKCMFQPHFYLIFKLFFAVFVGISLHFTANQLFCDFLLFRKLPFYCEKVYEANHF